MKRFFEEEFELEVMKKDLMDDDLDIGVEIGPEMIQYMESDEEDLPTPENMGYFFDEEEGLYKELDFDRK